MSDLTAFLLARIAEDEAVARAAVRRNGVDEWEVESTRGTMKAGPDVGRPSEVAVVIGPFKHGLDMPDTPTGGRRIVVAEHIARFDPARALAECEAKRRIIGDAQQSRDLADQPGHGQAAAEARAETLEEVLLVIATVYADHPDYRQLEWRP